MIGYKRKNVTFKENDPEEMQLHRLLQYLPHGEFSRMTKEFWRKYFMEKRVKDGESNEGN